MELIIFALMVSCAINARRIIFIGVFDFSKRKIILMRLLLMNFSLFTKYHIDPCDPEYEIGHHCCFVKCIRSWSCNQNLMKINEKWGVDRKLHWDSVIRNNSIDNVIFLLRFYIYTKRKISILNISILREKYLIFA